MKPFRKMTACMCALALLAAVPCTAYAQEIQPQEEIQVTPRAILTDWDIDTGNDGSDKTTDFHMEPGNGEYLRWYCEIDSFSAPAHVYLYDIGKGEIVSAMSPQVDPGEERTEVYYVGSDSEICLFRVIVESVTGDKVYGRIRAKQIISERTAEDIP